MGRAWSRKTATMLTTMAFVQTTTEKDVQVTTSFNSGSNIREIGQSGNTQRNSVIDNEALE